MRKRNPYKHSKVDCQYHRILYVHDVRVYLSGVHRSPQKVSLPPPQKHGTKFRSSAAGMQSWGAVTKIFLSQHTNGCQRQGRRRLPCRDRGGSPRNPPPPNPDQPSPACRLSGLLHGSLILSPGGAFLPAPVSNLYFLDNPANHRQDGLSVCLSVWPRWSGPDGFPWRHTTGPLHVCLSSRLATRVW